MSHSDTAAHLLDVAGETFAAEAGIELEDEPAPLYRLLVLTVLLSSRVQSKLGTATDGAEAVGLPTDPAELAELVDPDDLARFSAALVRANRDDEVAEQVT
jgi:hypothetical protein